MTKHRFFLIPWACLILVGCGRNFTRYSPSSSSSSPSASSSASSSSSPSSSSSSPSRPEDTVGSLSLCPKNFVPVPPLPDSLTKDFCVMKYEAKKGDTSAISQPLGSPWASIHRNEAIRQCRAMGKGYDLISNSQWQTIARNIESVPSNWSQNTVGSSGGLSRGHSDAEPNEALAASPSDNGPCQGTGESCNARTWNSQRRTHTLSNKEILWDMAGNLWEWVKDDNDKSYTHVGYFSQMTENSKPSVPSGSSNSSPTPGRRGFSPSRIFNPLGSRSNNKTSHTVKDRFGPKGNYSTLNSTPYGGLGFGALNVRGGGILRGGQWTSRDQAGVFTTNLMFPVLFSDKSVGFRCVWQKPETSSK